MESVMRGAVTYFFVWLVFRLSGKRTLAEITTFDALLLLIISECVQGALVGNDNSVTHSFLMILSMVGIDSILARLKQHSTVLARIVDGVPVVLVDPQGMREEAMKNERVEEDDILASARARHGVVSLSEIDLAVLEESGGISIILKRRPNEG
jgi:uncharacterized membrane protein YcaP (DUF421 family)